MQFFNYICSVCGHEWSAEVVREHGNLELVNPELDYCPKCGGEPESDDFMDIFKKNPVDTINFLVKETGKSITRKIAEGGRVN